MTFEIRGGFEAGMRFYDALKLFKRLVNLGDAKSLACHPASTTHRQMCPPGAAAAGVGPGSIRLSVGIEHIDDILADLDQALAPPPRRAAASTGDQVPEHPLPDAVAALFPSAAERAAHRRLAHRAS